MIRTSGNLRLSLSVMAVTALTPLPVAALAAPSNYVAGQLNLKSEAWSSAYSWARLQERVASWSTLPADWDGMDGVAPSAAVLANAESFIDAMQVAGISEPVADVAGDGEVSFHWKDGADIGTVSFLSDGHLVAYVRCGSQEALRIDCPCSEVATRELFDRLTRFA